MMNQSSRKFKITAALILTVITAIGAIYFAGISDSRVRADTNAQPIPFSQNWTNVNLITADDNWSGVPAIIGYRGDDLTTATGTDPRTLLADGSAVIDVIANQTNPDTLAAGGVAEFEIANPVVALEDSGTARSFIRSATLLPVSAWQLFPGAITSRIIWSRPPITPAIEEPIW